MIVPPYVKLGIIAAGAALAFYGGWSVRDWKCDADAAESFKAGVEAGKEQQANADARSTDYEAERGDAQVAARASDAQIRTIYKKVAVPVDCAPPEPALRVLRDSIRAANARAAGEPESLLPGDLADAGTRPGAAGVDQPAGEPVRGLRVAAPAHGRGVAEGDVGQ